MCKTNPFYAQHKKDSFLHETEHLRSKNESIEMDFDEWMNDR